MSSNKSSIPLEKLVGKMNPLKNPKRFKQPESISLNKKDTTPPTVNVNIIPSVINQNNPEQKPTIIPLVATIGEVPMPDLSIIEEPIIEDVSNITDITDGPEIPKDSEILEEV